MFRSCQTTQCCTLATQEEQSYNENLEKTDKEKQNIMRA